MKKIFGTGLCWFLALSAFAFGPFPVDEKVKQAFEAEFPTARDVRWYESAEAYEVYFVQGPVRARVAYAKDRAVVKYTRYYGDSLLPYAVRRSLQKQYPDLTVYGVTETFTVAGDRLQDVCYHVTLEDADRWVVVAVSEDEQTRVESRYKKQR